MSDLAPSQLDSFVKAAQKVGKGLTSIFKKKENAGAGQGPVSLEDLLTFSNVRSVKSYIRDVHSMNLGVACAGADPDLAFEVARRARQPGCQDVQWHPEVSG